MAPSRFAAITLAALVALPVTDAEAQATPPGATAPAGRDPGDPKAAVPRATYSSAFRLYRSNADVEVGNWRDLNENVGRVGGWRVYGREASPEANPPGKPAGNGKPDGTATAPSPAHGHKR